MKHSARIKSLIEFLSQLDDTNRPADSLLSYEFRQRRYIGSKDRADIANRFYRILRHTARYQWWAKQKGFEPTARIMVILDCAFHERHPDWDDLFSGDAYGADRLTAKEYDFAQYASKSDINHKDMPEMVRTECPEWLYARFKKLFGDNFVAEMDAMMEPAELHLRVNGLKTSREEAQIALKKNDIHPRLGALSPWCLIVDGRPPLSATDVFQQGWVEIQDEGSQLIALLTDVKPGERVVDFCSGAGGKALAMASMMENKGRLVACDVLEGKLKRAKVRYKRAGIHMIETRPLSSERDKWVKRSKGGFDCVLTDAPCSGTGTWKRNPDMRWRFHGPDLDELIVLQRSILESACRMVKPGGRLVYATCSLLPEENENQIEFFLKNNPDFERVSVAEIWKEKGFKPQDGMGDYMALTPGKTGTDGFFAAVMRRKEASTEAA